MTIAEELQALRSELAQLRAQIQAVQQRLQELTTVKEADQEYRQYLDEWDGKLAEAKKKKSDKEREKAHLELLLQTDKHAEEPVAPLRRRTWRGNYRPPAQTRSIETAGGAGRKRVSSDAGQRFKELVNRWYAYWGLKRTVLSQINRIADDPDGSPGEALMMLDEKLFTGPVLPEETEEEQVARLTEWREMLNHFRDRLSGEIDTQEIRSRDLLGIWEKWRTRGQSDAWRTFIAETIHARQDEIHEVEGQIAILEQEIADLKQQLHDKGIETWTSG